MGVRGATVSDRAFTRLVCWGVAVCAGCYAVAAYLVSDESATDVQ